MAKQKNIYDLSMQQLQDWAVGHGLKPYAATQLLQWLYAKRVASFEEMTNLSMAARACLSEEFVLDVLNCDQRYVSEDGSVKFVFRLHDGERIETVLMPQKQRITLCVSSQVGCGMGCTFCKTAELKLRRNLSQGEILGQVLAALKFCKSDDPDANNLQQITEREMVTNIVFMGMGEPLHNFGPVVEAVRILLDDLTFNFSRKKVTVSTVGLAREMIEFADALPACLAVSLNAGRDSVRNELMPINRKYNLKTLLAACREYAKRRDQLVTFEYVMLRDVNDSLEEAAELVRQIAHTPCKLNLIPFNEYDGSPYRRPDAHQIAAFHKYLADRGFQVNIRYSKGEDIAAACGQLVGIDI